MNLVNIFILIIQATCLVKLITGSKGIEDSGPLQSSKYELFRSARNLEIEESKYLLQNPLDDIINPGTERSGFDKLASYLKFRDLIRQRIQNPESQSRRIDKFQTSHYMEAIVKANSKTRNLPGISGKFGHHSPHQTVQGRLLHVVDEGADNSHYGCTREIANSKRIANISVPWIALISRGKCTFLIKIKLAEKYNASAVIIYNKKSNDNVEVMQTIGTNIPSLMIDATSGINLANLTKSNSPVFVNISVGRMYIKTPNNSPVKTTTPTKAIVNFKSKQRGSPPVILNKFTGTLTANSPSQSVSGKLIHISDFNMENSHYGCIGRIANEEELVISGERWIALVAKGECNPLIKIKLAEKYAASAIIIYDVNYIDEENVVNAYGAGIPTLSIGKDEGKKILNLIKNGETNAFVEIIVDSNTNPRQATAENLSATGGANTLQCCIVIILLSVIFASYQNLFLS